MTLTELQVKTDSLLNNMFLSYEECNNCIQVLESKYLNSLINKKNLELEDIEFLTKIQKNYPVEKGNLFKFCSLFKNLVRQRTNGACLLNNIWISQIKFKDLCFEHGLDDCKNIRIHGTNVHTCPDEIIKSNIIGIADSKFVYINIADMVAIGDFTK